MNLNQMKAAAVAVGSVLSSVLGTLYIPIILMVLCNITDYATGRMATTQPCRIPTYQERNVLNGATWA